MTKDSEKGRYASPEGSATWEYIGAISCASLMFCNGCIAAWPAPTLAILRGPDSRITLNSSDASNLASMSTLGYTASTILTLVIADKLGRKNSLLVSGVPLIVSWLMIAMSEEILVLLIARIICGVSYGLIISISPMYQGEIASPKLRGVVGMSSGVMMTGGMLFVSTIGPYLSIKMTAYVCLSIAALTLISISFMPDSPYFLVMVGKFEEAEDALVKLRGKPDVGEELELIKDTVVHKGNAEANSELGKSKHVDMVTKIIKPLKQLFTISANRKAFGINLLMTAAGQLGGFACIVTYSTLIFEKMETGLQPHVCSMVTATMPLICNILVTFVVDRVGRRPLILASGLVSGLCVLVIGVYFYLMEYTKVEVTPYGFLAFCTVVIYVIAFNLGMSPMQLVIQSEILATEVKAVTTFFIGLSGGLISVVGIKAYLMIAETWNFGHSVPFLGFAVVNWLSTVVTLKWLPETKGKTFLEIQRDMNA